MIPNAAKTSAAHAAAAAANAGPCLLVVDDEPRMLELIHDTLGKKLKCRLLSASTLAQARRILATEPVDLLLADVRLPDGNGESLLSALRRRDPLAGAIVMTGSPSLEGAISALRHGALDFLPKPFTMDSLLQRVHKALDRQAILTRGENRLDRLREAVRRLNQSRRIVSKKVDLLCNDLITAYGELSRQLDLVRTSESFRGALETTVDLEQMLCHAMDWMLRQLGYSNVAIWLCAEGGFQLGAYMKYTVAGDAELTEAMRQNLLPLVAHENFLKLDGEELRKKLTIAELEYLAEQTILASHCTYLGESLGAVVLFRDAAQPFSAADAETLRAITPIFALRLATLVRAAEKYVTEEEPSHGDSATEEPPPAGTEDQPPPRPRKDEADWWKRGEDPPF